MKKLRDGEMLDNLYFRQIQQSEEPKPLLSLYIQDTAQKGDSPHYSRLKKYGGPIMFVRSIALLAKDNLRSPLLASMQPRASLRVHGLEEN